MRRVGYLAIGMLTAVGCGKADTSHPPRQATTEAAPPEPAPAPPGDPMTDRVRELQPRRAPAPCVIADGALACWRGDAVVRTPLAGGASTTVEVPDPVRALGAGPGGAVVVAQDVGKRVARLLRLPAGGAAPIEVKAEYASSFANAAFVYAPSADRLYVASSSSLGVYKIGAMVEIAGAGIAWKADQLATVTGLADGVVYGEGGGLVRIGPGDQRAAFTSPIGSPLHLAAGADRDHVWATTDGAVALLALAGDAATVVHKVDVPGVYHLASFDGAAAVLSVAMKGGAWDAVTLTVIGADGAVRWRKVVPTPARQDAAVVAGSGYVAVVLDGTPHLFKAADGAAVP